MLSWEVFINFQSNICRKISDYFSEYPISGKKKKNKQTVISPFNYLPQAMNGTKLKSRITLFHNTKSFTFFFRRTFLPKFSQSFFSREKFIGVIFLVISSSFNSQKMLHPWSRIWLDRVRSHQLGRPPNSSNI